MPVVNVSASINPKCVLPGWRRRISSTKPPLSRAGVAGTLGGSLGPGYGRPRRARWRPAGRDAWATTHNWHAVAEPRIVTDDGSPAPSGLVDAVLGFEAAVSSGDQEAIAHFFERGDRT